MSTATEHRFRPGLLLFGAVATVLLLWLFGTVADILLLLFIASLLAVYLGAATDFISRRAGLPRRLAFLIALFGSLFLVFGVGALLVPPVIAQTRQLLGVLPEYITAWQAGLSRLIARYPLLQDVAIPQPGEVVSTIMEHAQGALTGVVPRVVAIGHSIVNAVSILVMGIYLSLYPGLYREWLIALFPPVHRDTVRDVLADMAKTLRQWIVAQIIAMTVLAILTGIGLYLLRVPYWLPFAVFTGAVAIVPFFGTLVSSLLPAVFVLGGPGLGSIGPGGHALLVVLLGFVIHIIEGNVVVPLIVSHQVEIPPVLSMMAILMVGRLLGFEGIIVAVPMLAAVMVVVRRVLIRRVYEGQSVQRAARDRVLVLRVPAPDGNVITPPGAAVDVLHVEGSAPHAA